MSLVGVGQSLQVAGTLFRMTVDYPVERYDEAFDPWPGQYYAVVSGLALGPHPRLGRQ